MSYKNQNENVIHQGFLIAFEGCEGSGKSTQAKILYDQLVADGIPAVLTREPGGTSIGNQIRSILLHKDNTELCALSELFLYEASRSQHIHEVIKPALAEDKVVITDRYLLASIAYQGIGRGLGIPLVSQQNEIAVGSYYPDVTIILDIPPELGLERSQQKLQEQGLTVEEGRFEAEELAFHSHVRNAYLSVAAERGVYTLHAVDPVDKLSRLIRRFVYKERYNQQKEKNEFENLFKQTLEKES